MARLVRATESTLTGIAYRLRDLFPPAASTCCPARPRRPAGSAPSTRCRSCCFQRAGPCVRAGLRCELPARCTGQRRVPAALWARAGPPSRWNCSVPDLRPIWHGGCASRDRPGDGTPGQLGRKVRENRRRRDKAARAPAGALQGWLGSGSARASPLRDPPRRTSHRSFGRRHSSPILLPPPRLGGGRSSFRTWSRTRHRTRPRTSRSFLSRSSM